MNTRCSAPHFVIQLQHTPRFPPPPPSTSWLASGAAKPVSPRFVALAAPPRPAHCPPSSVLLLRYAADGLLHRAWPLWLRLLSDPSFVPDLPLLSLLISACGDARRFDLVLRILDRLSSAAVPPGLLRQAHSVAISCFADHAQLRLMEHTLSLMLSRGFSIDSATGDAFLRYYSSFASLDDMENAYSWLKRSRHLPSQVGITAVALAYVRDRKLYRLGQFLRDVGLGRKDLGNLLWNLLLLSYAANFKMKSLQREFLNMVHAGFCPDVTTFNIRLLAFSRMSMFWDLHLSLEHMKRTGIVPDLVTYGCVVDSYLDRRLGRNLRFVLDKMNLDDAPQVLTDSFVFQAFGKGNFHSTSEAFLEFRRNRSPWTYRKVVTTYLRKQYRTDRNQIFWNY